MIRTFGFISIANDTKQETRHANSAAAVATRDVGDRSTERGGAGTTYRGRREHALGIEEERISQQGMMGGNGPEAPARFNNLLTSLHQKNTAALLYLL